MATAATDGRARPTMHLVFEYLGAHSQYAIAALLGWVILYLIYRVGWRRDFGMPVRRRLLALRLRVDREQLAFVPFWWTDLQVQRALDNHWQRTMSRSLQRPVRRAG